MSRTLSSLKKRVKSIETTKKITNTMKLVSMSKYQVYQRQLSDIETVYKGLQDMGSVISQEQKPRLALCVVPDLGLISIFVKTLLKELELSNYTDLLWIGTQGYEMMKDHPQFKVHNAMIRSESLDAVELHTLIQTYQNDFDIDLVQANVQGHNGISMTIVPISIELKYDENKDYEPSYEVVNEAFKERYAYFLSEFARTNNKVVEHKLRQINMDKASDSAQEMLDHLNNEYHKLRQAKITQEITEIVSGRM